MPWLRCIFLLAALATTSGFKFRCFMFCSDLTAVQQDYNTVRDECREYAQLKVSSGPLGEDDPERRLVGYFSECMGKKGWDVPSGGDDGSIRASGMPGFPPVGTAPVAPQEAPPATGFVPQPMVPMVATPTQEQTAYLKRSSECAFARHSASVSSNARARAKACDIECAQRLKSMPDAPRPAACPAETNPTITPNMDKR